MLARREREDADRRAEIAGDVGQALRAHCRRVLADYKVPETISWSAEPLPRNANGKVLKRLLRERLAAEDAPDSLPTSR